MSAAVCCGGAAAISRPELNGIRPILVARRKKAKSGVDFCEWVENWQCSAVDRGDFELRCSGGRSVGAGVVLVRVLLQQHSA